MANMSDAPTKPRRRWLRFSIRSLLLLIALIAIPLAWKVNRAQNQRRVVAEVERLKGSIVWVHEELPPFYSDNDPPGPLWLRNILGDDFFADVCRIDIANPNCDDDTLAQIATLPSLNTISLMSDGITDRGRAYLTHLKTLETLLINSERVTDSGLKHVAQLPPRLVNLLLDCPQVTSAGLQFLNGRDNFRTLAARRARVSDSGLSVIGKMAHLQVLSLCAMQITDAGLDDLKELKHLKEVSLIELQVSQARVNELRNALPNCTINFHK